MIENDYLADKLTEIEKSIAEQESKIELGSALKYLVGLPEFKLVVGHGYLQSEIDNATTIVINTLDPTSPEVREALEKIASVNRLKEYFEGILEEALYAPGRIEQEQDFRTEYTAENSEVTNNE